MNNRHLSAFKLILTFDTFDLYGYGCLRMVIERNTGEQILGYIKN